MAMNSLWEAAPARRDASAMMRFMQLINRNQQSALPASTATSTPSTASTSATPPLQTYADLHAWSVQHVPEFWAAIAAFFDVQFHTPAQSILTGGFLDAHWFSGAKLNFAENLLRGPDQHIAIEFRNERGDQRTLSFQALRVAVAQCAAGLTRAGVVQGDRVAGLLPNIPETVIAMLATTAIGAIWSSCSPDFGMQAVLERYSQITPKILFTTDAALYGSKLISTLDKARQCLAQLPWLQVVVISYIDPHFDQRLEPSDLSGLSDPNDPSDPSSHSNSSNPSNPMNHNDPAATIADWATPYAQFIDARVQQCTFASVPFNHPVVILYSSGTTGAPKCITHGGGGILLQHFKDLGLHTEIAAQDIVFYYTTCGWMMWNWLVSSLGLGATIVLYDGSPLNPSTTRLLDLVDEVGITVFGASAKYYSTLEKAGVVPRQTHTLSTLKTLLSTGSTLLPEQYDYIYQKFKADVCLASISGGTDLISCFALGCPLKPVYRGQLQCLGLGMDVAIYNEAGQAVVAEKGELVCRQPFPTLPLYFWNDPQKQQYTAAYFAQFPGVWAHGDFAEITAEGGLIVYGRSDATLKPGGVRVGTAEIYRVVEQFPEIVESVCVGHVITGDEKIILFVVMQADSPLSDAIIHTVKHTIREQVSPHHVPYRVYAVSQLPRTINGKLVELAIRDILNGKPIKNKTALINPEVLPEFELIAEKLRT